MPSLTAEAKHRRAMPVRMQIRCVSCARARNSLARPLRQDAEAETQEYRGRGRSLVATLCEVHRLCKIRLVLVHSSSGIALQA